jgi:hypothetical protein
VDGNLAFFPQLLGFINFYIALTTACVHDKYLPAPFDLLLLVGIKLPLSALPYISL